MTELFAEPSVYEIYWFYILVHVFFVVVSFSFIYRKADLSNFKRQKNITEKRNPFTSLQNVMFVTHHYLLTGLVSVPKQRVVNKLGNNEEIIFIIYSPLQYVWMFKCFHIVFILQLQTWMCWILILSSTQSNIWLWNGKKNITWLEKTSLQIKTFGIIYDKWG